MTTRDRIIENIVAERERQVALMAAIQRHLTSAIHGMIGSVT